MYSSRTSFSFVFFTSFSLLSACIKVVSPKFIKYCPILGSETKLPFVLLYLNACIYLAPLRRCGASGVTTLTFWGQVTSSVTCLSLWPCVYLAPLWRYGHLKFFQEQVGRRSVLNITLISYTPLCYNGNVACEEYKTEMKQL